MKLDFISNIGEQKTEDSEKKVLHKWLLLGLVAIFFIAVVILGLLIGFTVAYQEKIIPGVHVGSIDMSGLAKQDALALLTTETDKISQSGINLLYKNGNDSYLKVAPTVDSSGDPDLSRDIISFNNDHTIDAAFSMGRNKNMFVALTQVIIGITKGIATPVSADIDREALRRTIKDQFNELEKPGTNALPKITWSGSKYAIEVVPEQSGSSFDYEAVVNKIVSNIRILNSEPITLQKKDSVPDVVYHDVDANKSLIDQVLATSTVMTYQKDEWHITPKALSPLLMFTKVNGVISLSLDHSGWQSWAEKNLIPHINIAAEDARIEMATGTAMRIVSHKNGQEIDMEKTYQDVVASLLSDNRRVAITVKESLPKITVDNVNDLGIKEIIGVGKSNFAGSPTNRRWNIKTGANKLQGILIKPGEEFSVITALGDIDASTGYKPELVIKGNKTMPEYGGGLCQIGTTVFRAAMAAGLPITERRNHSYNVAYYLENGLPGVDATIYQFHPDLRFVNDTGNYILIQYTIAGNDLKFEFWGTKDGRTSNRTKPTVWGWVSPPDTKIIETTDLAPGVKKCTESSHKGVNASFDYLITYANGQTKKQTFTSHYKPWQAVCLLGVDKISQTATSTAPIVQ